MPKNRNVLHFHIPKTAGSALRHFLIDQHGEGSVSPPIAGLKLHDALLQWSHCQVISGHFAVLQGDLLPTDRYAITVLRDPIDRFLSDHFFRKYDNADRLIDTGLQASDLDSLLTSGSLRYDNGLCVQLDMLFPLGIAPLPFTSVEEKVRAAQLAIDRFDAVGIQEDLEDFASMLCAEFGWDYKPLPRVNRTSRRVPIETLTSAQRQAIQTLLEPEIEVYRYAASRFRKDRRRYVLASTHGLGDGSSREEKSTVEPPTPSASPANPRNFGDKQCEIASVEVQGMLSGPSTALAGERMTIAVRFVAHGALEQLNVGIAIKDERGMVVYGTNTQLLGQNYALLSPGEYEVTFSLLNRLGCGYYHVDAALVRGATHLDGCYHWLEHATKFEVPGLAVSHFEGRVMMDASIAMNALGEDANWELSAVEVCNTSVGSFGRLNPMLKNFSAMIEPMAKFEKAVAGTDVLLQIRAKNTGDDAWIANGRNPVNLSYRWLTMDGVMETADGIRTPLPTDVAPNEEAIVPLHIRMPSRAGAYELVVSPLQEQNAWFVDCNANSGFALLIDVCA